MSSGASEQPMPRGAGVYGVVSRQAGIPLRRSRFRRNNQVLGPRPGDEHARHERVLGRMEGGRPRAAVLEITDGSVKRQLRAQGLQVGLDLRPRVRREKKRRPETGRRRQHAP